MGQDLVPDDLSTLIVPTPLRGRLLDAAISQKVKRRPRRFLEKVNQGRETMVEK